jgi:transglutaminase-like putative cysteine protease/uncharacterized protein (DUF58 family)
MGRRPRARRLPRLTPAAWRLVLLALGLLGAAVNTGNNLVYLMFSLLAAALPVSAAVGALNLRGLRGALKLPRAARAGAPFVVEVTLHVARRWPAARSIEIAVPAAGEPIDRALVERAEVRHRVPALLPGSVARRGPLAVDGVRLRSTFPLGFLRHERWIHGPAELLVLPAPSPAADGPTAAGSPRSGGGPLAARVAGTEYAGLRRGDGEDDARVVDWKVTARRGVTIVRETAGESPREHRLEIATRCSGEPRAARRAFEQRVASVAGQARRALDEGGAVRLIVDGRAAGDYAGPRGRLALLRRLARLEPVAADGTPLPREVAPRRADPAVAPAPARADATARTLRHSALASLTVGAFALFVAGGTGAAMLALLLASIAVTARSERWLTRERSTGRRLWQAAAVAALVVYVVDVLALRRDMLAASLWLLVSFLHIVLAAALTTEVVLAVPLLAWLLAAVQALLAATALHGPAVRAVPSGPQRMPWARPAGAVGAATLATALAVYVAVPHLGTGAFRPSTFRAARTTGFSESATLGDIGRIKLDRSKVMEVDLRGRVPAEADLRWRGLTLSEFDGRTWSRGRAVWARRTADGRGRVDLPARATSTAGALHQEIRLEPGPGTALFAAARPASVLSTDFHYLREDDSGNIELPRQAHRRLSYTVTSELPARTDRLRNAMGDDPPQVRDENLRLPALDPRIPHLARQITRDAPTRYDAALALERWLSTQLAYSLTVDDRAVEDPLTRFLFDGMPAHCEYFATAMVVLARAADIPARFVAGYLSGEESRFAERYVVRQSDAHAWVEVHFPGAGWIPFDPTPPVGRAVAAADAGSFARHVLSSVTRLWDDYIVGFDLDDQERTLLALTATVDRLGGAARRAGAAVAGWRPWRWVVSLLVAALVVGLARRVVRRWPVGRSARRPGGPLPGFYAAALRLLGRRGLARAPAETPLELARRAAGTLPPRGAERLLELTRLYYRVRFDGVTDERRAAGIARALLADLRATLDRR